MALVGSAKPCGDVRRVRRSVWSALLNARTAVPRHITAAMVGSRRRGKRFVRERQALKPRSQNRSNVFVSKRTRCRFAFIVVPAALGTTSTAGAYFVHGPLISS